MQFRLTQIFSSKFVNVFLLYIYTDTSPQLGRWSLLNNKSQLENRIRLANYDNCGVSSNLKKKII